MRAIQKKVAVSVAAGVIVMAGGGTAFAFWSTSGSGTGSASTSVGAANLSIAQTSTIQGMFPGDTAQTISGTVTNNAQNAAYVSKVTASIASVSTAAGVTATCDASDYTLANPDMTVGQDIGAGGSASFTGATIKFNNKGTNQDGCKGATVNLSYAAS